MNPLLDSRRIAILKFTSLGGVLLATPVATNLRKANPSAFIAWIVDECFADLPSATKRAAALDLTGQTTIGQLAAGLERCSLLVAGDSGPLYLANPLGCPKCTYS